MNDQQQRETHNRFKAKRRVFGFAYAARGIVTMVRSQHNAWVHSLATAAAVTFGILFGFSTPDWCWVVLAIVSVWTAESFNTAFEFLADAASPEFHPLIRKAKDVAAGGVLCSVIGSVVIGVLVFGPHLVRFLAVTKEAL